jgi:hypothetical protein
MFSYLLGFLLGLGAIVGFVIASIPAVSDILRYRRMRRM